MSRWVELILVSVFWRKRLSCASVEVRSCIVLVVVEERGTCRVAVSCRVARKQHVAGALAGRLLHVSSQQPKSRHSVRNRVPGFATECLDFGTGLVPHVPGELPGSFASLLGRSGPCLGQCSHFLSPLVRPRGSRHTPENPQSEHTGRRTERSRTHTMRTRIFER